MRTLFLMLIIMTSLQIQSQYKKQKKYPKLTVSVAIASKLSPQQTFEYIVPMDLEHIFKRYKNIPAVDSTSNKEAWYKAGMKRTVFFDDGTSSEETLLSLTSHSGFRYEVNGFTNALKGLIEQINGGWEFKELDDQTIGIEWTYELVPKNFIARFLIKLIVKKRVKTSMINALNIIKNELENGNLHRYERRVGNW